MYPTSLRSQISIAAKQYPEWATNVYLQTTKVGSWNNIVSLYIDPSEHQHTCKLKNQRTIRNINQTTNFDGNKKQQASNTQ